jgi:hypothetical protein
MSLSAFWRKMGYTVLVPSPNDHQSSERREITLTLFSDDGQVFDYSAVDEVVHVLEESASTKLEKKFDIQDLRIDPFSLKTMSIVAVELPWRHRARN